MADDYSNTIETTGTAAVGGSTTGNIETAGDKDWIAVELEAGRTYRFDLAGSPTGDGTLSDTFLRRILDAEGNKSTGDGAHASYNDDFGGSRNSRVTFTATQSGTYHVETSGDRNETGTYTLSMADVTPAVVSDPDAERTGARDLGDLTALPVARFHRDAVDGTEDALDYYRFTLSGARTVELGLRRQDADADLFLEDAAGNVVAESTRDGAANEALRARLEAGTYYVRVEAQEAGANAHVFRYGVSAAQAPALAVDTDAGRGGATELSLGSGSLLVTGSVDGVGDAVDYHRFTLSETKQVNLVLVGATAGESGNWEMQRDADLSLEDAEGNVLARSAAEGRGGEIVQNTLSAGTYYVQVEAKQAGNNAYQLSTQLVNPAQIEVSDAEGHESEEGTLRFRISLDRAAVNPVTVRYETVDGTAVAGEDYEATSGELTFAAGETEKWVEVTLIDDTEEDSGETLGLRLNSVTGAVLGDASGIGTILNTETTPVSVSEPAGEDFAADTTTAGRVVVGESATGELAPVGDVDWFAVELEAGKNYQIDLKGSSHDSGTLPYPVLNGICDDGGTRMASTRVFERGVGFSSRMIFRRRRPAPTMWPPVPTIRETKARTCCR